MAKDADDRAASTAFFCRAALLVLAAIPALRSLVHSDDPAARLRHDRAGLFSPSSGMTLYVPNSDGNSVDVIVPTTLMVLAHFGVLRTLYVLDDAGNTLTPIDPRSTRPRKPIRVAAWLASPAPTGLQARVQARLRGPRSRSTPPAEIAPILA